MSKTTSTSATTSTVKKPSTADDTAKVNPAKQHRHKLSRQTKSKIWFTIFCLAWAVFATYAGQFIIIWPMYWLLGNKLQDPGWMLLYYILTYALTLALVLVVPLAAVRFCRKQQQTKSLSKINPKTLDHLEADLSISKNEMGLNKLPTFVDIGLAPVGYVVYLVIAMVLTQLMSLFAWFNVDQAQNVGFGYYVTSLDRIFALLAIVIIAPVAEELVMRGWLYGKIRSRWGVAVSMLIVSLLFAVLHGQWNVGVSVFALSLVLCGLREITGTIWSGMLLHILSNGIAFYLLYIAI